MNSKEQERGLWPQDVLHPGNSDTFSFPPSLESSTPTRHNIAEKCPHSAVTISLSLLHLSGVGARVGWPRLL